MSSRSAKLFLDDIRKAIDKIEKYTDDMTFT